MGRKCPNCGRDLERYPAINPNQECPKWWEVILDKLGLPTRWKRYREKV